MTATAEKVASAEAGQSTRLTEELAALLAPVSVEEFYREYLGKKPLYIKGSGAKLNGLFQGPFGKADLLCAVEQTAANAVFPLEITSILPKGGASDGVVRRNVTRRLRADQVESMFGAGANISITGLTVPRIGALLSAVKTQLQYPGETNFVTILSPGGVGFPPHIDASSQFFIQAEGRKRYRISPAPVVEWPRGTTVFAPDGSVESCDHVLEDWELPPVFDWSTLTEIEMGPGDILYCPPGIVHATEALGSHCVNVIFSFDQINFWKLASQVFDSLTVHDRRWRHIPGAGYNESAPGDLPASVERFFGERLDELKELVNGMDAKSFLLHCEWKKMVADPGKTTRAGLQVAGSGAVCGAVAPGDAMELRRVATTSAKHLGPDGTAVLNVYFGAKEISVSGSWAPFLETLLRTPRFVAADAVQWSEDGDPYPWETVAEYLETLADLGILARR